MRITFNYYEILIFFYSYNKALSIKPREKLFANKGLLLEKMNRYAEAILWFFI